VTGEKSIKALQLKLSKYKSDRLVSG